MQFLICTTLRCPAVHKKLLTLALSLCVLASLTMRGTEARAFLGYPGLGMAEVDIETKAQRAILLELEELLGEERRNVTELRMGRLVELLRPSFAALPKNAQGRVGAPAARYALHRLFEQQHGWHLLGLQASGEGWGDGASPTSALGDRVPEQVREMFAQRLQNNGFNLHELAVLAGVLENMIHGEAESILGSIYGLLRYPLEGAVLSPSEATRVIEMYMSSYILGVNPAGMTVEQVLSFNATIEEQHPSWNETRKFLSEVQRTVVRPGAEGLAFQDIAAVVETAADRFGHWQTQECAALKQDLVKLEEVNGTGRVRLADFYGSALDGGRWQFSETVEYLRQLGALDETDPSALRVIIPNYINSPSNCLASSSFYAVCCIDECGLLLGRLEAQLGRPTATSEEILAALRRVPPPSSPLSEEAAPGWAPPAGLVRRLEEVAAFHGGGPVPIHGRLLAQWLHHAFPHECPYPHVSGTTRPQRPDEFEAITGRDSTASEEEMRQHIEAAVGARRRPVAKPSGEEEGLCSPMWTLEEELVDAQAQLPTGSPAADAVSAASTTAAAPVAAAQLPPARRAVLRCLAVVAAVGSLLLALAKILGPALETPSPFFAACRGSHPAACPPPLAQHQQQQQRYCV